MSGVRLKDRTKSKSQFDNTYVKPTRSQLVQDAFKNEFSKEYAILNY